MGKVYDAPTSKSYVNNIYAKQRSRQKALQFRKLPRKKKHKPSRKKEKASPHIKHFHNPFSFTKQYICRHIYGLIYMPDNLLAVYALKISGRFRLFCVQTDHQLHELNHIFIIRLSTLYSANFIKQNVL